MSCLRQQPSKQKSVVRIRSNLSFIKLGFVFALYRFHPFFKYSETHEISNNLCCVDLNKNLKTANVVQSFVHQSFSPNELVLPYVVVVCMTAINNYFYLI